MNVETILFYEWCQFAACLFSLIALLAIWWHIGKKQNEFGQVWLALSILCWSFSILAEVYFTLSNIQSNFLVEGFGSVLILLNSLFRLLALPWFRCLPKPIVHIIKSPYWLYIIGIPFLFSLLPIPNKKSNHFSDWIFLVGVAGLTSLILLEVVTN
ncbi:hypothetical protein [Aquimarina intermedia]|uniref:Histidine kinase N-terminal 7TM region domain-containing protein n=1 Tax=Aquimarina intermedia TaxID=350814 RepID=A0A5S5C057_9FLAO|nr:hypothetical protein [Aquimarina intermedia]TYP72831.1 hypothetical protein BD809_10680 [Aquimarina intermedia]